MSCCVSRQIFGDAADVGQLLQVGVHLLVAAYGEQHSVRLAVGVILVTVDNLLCLVQQRYVAHIFGLLTSFANPNHSVNICYQVLRFKLFNIRECKSSQATKTKYITDLCQTRNRNIFI